MIHDFLESWPLFAQAWVSSWLIAAVLGLLGSILLVREQVFLGAAMCQAATAGVALALALAFHISTAARAWIVAPLAIVAALATALLVGMGRGHRESVTAWVFLAASAAAVLLATGNAHGLEEVQRLIASSIIGASWIDVGFFAALLALLIAVAAVAGRRLTTLLLDPAFAAVIGIRSRRWELAIAVLLGLAIGWSLQVAGLIYTFGCLILPAMAARHLAREFRAMAILAPVLASVCAIVASVCANAWDLPPAQVAVACMAGVVVLAAGWRRLVDGGV